MKRMKRYLSVVAALALVLSLLAGCAGGKENTVTPDPTPGTEVGTGAEPTEPAKPAESTEPAEPAEPTASAYGDGVIGGRDDSGYPEAEAAYESKSASSAEAAMEIPASYAMDMATTYAAEPTETAGMYDGLGGGDVIIEPMPPIDLPPIETPPGAEIAPQAGLLTAGAWNDNENFAFFTDVLGREEWKELQALWGIRPTRRCAVHVTDAGTQEPLRGAVVELLRGDETIASAVTDHNGDAFVYYDLAGSGQYEPDAVRATWGGETALKEGVTVGERIELALGGLTADERKTLDLMFMIDTTGSMGDELEYLKEELRDVIRRVSNANDGMCIRLSVNFYRDEGDEYVVKYFAFTEDIERALDNLRAQYSDGGGDYPEAVDTALENAVSGHEWYEDSVKLLFFVLDAPPHSDRQGTPERLRENIEAAAQRGIRILPVVSSGTDTETEFLMRSAAAVTGGTYVILTDDSGIGYSHLEPTIGDYTVRPLNTLLIELINEYCR